MEKGQSRRAFFFCLIGIGIVVLVILVSIFAFSVEHRKALYAGYARELYYDALLYATLNQSDAMYDESDDTYDYITDLKRVAPEFPYGGEARIAFAKDGSIVSAWWTKAGAADFVDRFSRITAEYPGNSLK